MNRKPRLAGKISITQDGLCRWKNHLTTRRQFLISAAGGSLAAVFPLSAHAIEHNKLKTNSSPWLVLNTLQQHLLPTEANTPGAKEINALGYLKFVVADTTLDTDTRNFITQGVIWLEDMTQQMYKQSFIKLNELKREAVLQRIAKSEAGENWLSTLMLYITEALLTDPVYGGNTHQVGWKWLQHTPGFPRPPPDKTFPQLLAHDY